MDKQQEEIWLPVIGKALAVLAMHRAELGNSEIIAKAEFLEGLGVPRADVATMLGSSSESLRVMHSSRKKKKGAKRGKGKGKSKKG
ncbi:MAG: hypothetical protein AB7P31_14560 [Steroidobacteraceae bacterium]